MATTQHKLFKETICSASNRHTTETDKLKLTENVCLCVYKCICKIIIVKDLLLVYFLFFAFFIFRKTRHVLFGATIMYNKIHWCFGIPQKVKRKSLKPYKCYTCKFNNKTNQILKKFFSFYYIHAIISPIEDNLTTYSFEQIKVYEKDMKTVCGSHFVWICYWKQIWCVRR